MLYKVQQGRTVSCYPVTLIGTREKLVSKTGFAAVIIVPKYSILDLLLSKVYMYTYTDSLCSPIGCKGLHVYGLTV